MEKITLLIVDDVEMNRDIVRKMFGDTYNILEASNGIEAMEVIKTNTIGIAITDIFMEPMDGYELIHNIRSTDAYKKIPIIAVTESDQASRKKALKAGADDLIYRPFISSILHNRVNGLLFDGFDIDKYKLAYENNPIPYILYHVIDRPDTPSYKIIYLNRAARSNFVNFFEEDVLWTDERPEHRDMLLSALRTGESKHSSNYDENAGKWFDWMVYPDGNGLVAAIVHDITEQVSAQSEAAKRDAMEAIEAKNYLSNILGNIPGGIFVFRIDEDNFSVIASNHSGCRQIGIDYDKVLGVNKDKILSFVHPEDIKVVTDAIDRLRTPETEVSYQCRLFNRGKNMYVWFSAQAYSKTQPDGVLYAFISFSDITTEKQLAETKMELGAAKKANQAKTEFLSKMSHDMRTPLNGILGLIELMQDKNDIKDIKDDLSQIKLSGHYLLNLMNDTLDISKIEAGKLELHEEPADSETIMQNILANAQLMASGKGIQLKIIIPPIEKQAWKPVIVDSARLEQILINLISNAIKYTPEKGVVEVRMESLSVTDTEVVDKYIIKDTGIGMSATFLPHMFEPFSQEGRMYTKRQNGTGLGLAIVKQLVDLMGGEIKVTSEVNVGTEVTLIMRYKVSQVPLEHKKEESTDVLNGKHILLCEDHPLNAQIATRLLEKTGAKIDQASDGNIGVNMYEAAADGYYSAILMDIRMPVMDGIEAAKAIRKSGKRDSATIPIIAMTANAFDEDVDNCINAGMNAHLAKPVDPKVMYQTLIKCIK